MESLKPINRKRSPKLAGKGKPIFNAKYGYIKKNREESETERVIVVKIS